jgi:hypothetical protein
MAVMTEDGRKVVFVTAEHGRDAGKIFKIKEWSAARAEHWGVKALLAYNRGGGDLDMPSMYGMGMVAVVYIGVQTFLRGSMRSDEVIPILDELLECVQPVRDPKARDAITGGMVADSVLNESDIEEVATRMWLRSEVIKLHTGFSPAAALSELISLIMTTTEAAAESQSAKTSHP